MECFSTCETCWTMYGKRFGAKFDGPVIPFGGKVSYKPITGKEDGKIHQFDERM